jgi:hypothetical protein
VVSLNLWQLKVHLLPEKVNCVSDVSGGLVLCYVTLYAYHFTMYFNEWVVPNARYTWYTGTGNGTVILLDIWETWETLGEMETGPARTIRSQWRVRENPRKKRSICENPRNMYWYFRKFAKTRGTSEHQLCKSRKPEERCENLRNVFIVRTECFRTYFAKTRGTLRKPEEHCENPRKYEMSTYFSVYIFF